MNKDILKMNLQMFAEGDGEADPEPQVSVAEMQRRIAAEQSKYEEKIKAYEDEKKKAKMDDEQKLTYEQEQLKAQNKELESKLKRMEARSSVVNKFSEHGLVIDDAMLDLVVSSDQDQSLKNTDVLHAYVQAAINEHVKQNARQEPPKSSYTTMPPVTESRGDIFRSARKI